MELSLQFGYGMMEHCRHLLASWGGGGVILSPRDLSDRQLRTLAEDISKIAGTRLFLDPQFYLPHADHERLCSHEYWPSNYESGTFFQGAELRKLLSKLFVLNDDLGSTAVILPGVLATNVDDTWLEAHRSVVESAADLAGGRSLIATIALGADSARDSDQIAMLLDSWLALEVDAFYVVFEHPNGEYLVRDPLWMANLLDLVAGLRLAGKRAIVGYCNQQMLALSAAGASALCSGTWMNVRSFPQEKFRSSYDEEIKQRATWYYCPQALSEYKIAFLDVAQRQKLLGSMSPPPELDGGYASRLFDGPPPTTVGFSEQLAFRHYLHAIHTQAAAMNFGSYDEALEAQEGLLVTAERLLARLAVAAVLGQQRDFREVVDVNRAALALLDSTRGPMLRRNWKSVGGG